MAKASQRGAAVRDQDDDTEFDASPTRRPSAGAGGRWLVGLGRVVLWLFILVVIFNGIWIPLRGGFAFSTPADEPEQTESFTYPETAATTFALGFAEAYVDTEDPEARLNALASYVPEGRVAALELPADSLTGENLTVVGVDVRDDHNAMITVRGDINGETMALDVPVYADPDGSLAVAGRPALLAAPPVGAPQQPQAEADEASAPAIQEMLEGFFEAYAQDDHLDRYVETGVSIAALPEESLVFAELADITVLSHTSTGDDEDVRQVPVTVRWDIPGPDEGSAGRLAQDYLVTVVHTGDGWDVRDIQGSPFALGD